MPSHDAIEMIAGIELNAGRVGPHRQLAATAGVVEPYDGFERFSAFTHDITMIEAACTRELIMRPVESGAERSTRAEIERMSRDLSAALGDQRCVDFEERVGVDGDDVAADIGGFVARQVEAGVVRQVERRWRIRYGFIRERQRAVVVERVA